MVQSRRLCVSSAVGSSAVSMFASLLMCRDSLEWAGSCRPRTTGSVLKMRCGVVDVVWNIAALLDADSPPNSRLQPTEIAAFGSVVRRGLVLARCSAAEALPR